MLGIIKNKDKKKETKKPKTTCKKNNKDGMSW